MRRALDPPHRPDPADPPAPLRTLGGLALGEAGRAQVKGLLLLAFLALEGPQPRRRLARLFWPRATDGLNRLSVTLSRLRVLAPGSVTADRHRVASHLDTDFAALARALDQGRTDEALARYRGPFLDGVVVRGIGEELEEWIATTRDRVAVRLQRSLWRDVRAATEAGTLERAAAAAERVLDVAGTALLEPAELEELHLVLLAGASARAEAVANDLAALGLTATTSADEARERFAGVAGRPRVATNLQPAATPIVGRERERIELTRMLARPDHRLVTLVGPGGMGKSRLALQVATDELDGGRFRDGIFFVRLEAATSVTDVPEHIAADLGVAVAGDGDALQALTTALRARRALVVLDNLEHLPGAAPVVAELLASCPHLQVLATSRDRLDVDGEWRDHLCFAMTAEEPPTGGLVGRVVAAGWAEQV
ncbi:MAG: AAA family ATPase, partial [Trueperaceae bacterium]|nr:AAA family ATPase [Trueperaceae bacterium]